MVAAGHRFPEAVAQLADDVARRGSTPLVVADGGKALGVIELKDVVKGGIRERFADLRAMGIRTVMITGDNRLTAAAIAAEAGVDDFLAEATPEDKLALIRRHQAEGKLVAMTGDGTNDAPALAQADVAVAMNSGTQAAKEAGNMVDLDSNPTKLIEIIEIGKQMLMTRGALTTFSIANDVAKYFAIVPAAFVGFYPQLAVLDVMRLGSPDVAILAAVIFNALIIVALLPLPCKGIAYKPLGAAALLRQNLLIYGLGGLIVPFVGIKLLALLLEPPPRDSGIMKELASALFPLRRAHRGDSAWSSRRVVTGVAALSPAPRGRPAAWSPPPADSGWSAPSWSASSSSAPGYFWSRPSAPSSKPYNPRFLWARTSPPATRRWPSRRPPGWRPCRPAIRARGADPGGPRHRLGQRPRSRHLAGRGPLAGPGWPAPAASARPRSAP